jgi:membrane protein DedA with SNARE-associated domain
MLQLQNIITWMRYVATQYGYLGVLAISLAGASSILVPVPDTVVVFTLAGLRVGASWVFDPLLIALAAAAGGAIGEFSGYVLGLTGQKAITGRYRKNVDFFVRIFDKFGTTAIFLFALTPLPDNLVFIPLGVTHYDPVKAFGSAMAGKFLMSLLVAYGGRFSIGIIRDLCGVGSSLVSVLISLVAGVALAIAMFKVDWARHFEKYLIK